MFRYFHHFLIIFKKAKVCHSRSSLGFFFLSSIFLVSISVNVRYAFYFIIFILYIGSFITFLFAFFCVCGKFCSLAPLDCTDSAETSHRCNSYQRFPVDAKPRSCVAKQMTRACILVNTCSTDKLPSQSHSAVFLQLAHPF